MRVSPPPTQRVDSSLPLDATDSKSESAFQWLPTAAALSIIDPNQPKPLMKLPISIEQNSIQFHTTVLIDSVATLNFVCQNFVTQNNLLGKCTRGSKVALQIANEQRIFTNKTFSPSCVYIGQKKFTGLNFTVLPHLKCVDFFLVFQQ
jgi:hypothetical protein